MNKKITSLTLTDKEFFLLAMITGANQVVGMSDPFMGYLTEEIEAEWVGLKEVMIQKGYLYEDATGLYIDEAVDFFVNTCGTAETVAHFYCVRNEEKPIESYLYFREEAVVQTQCEDDHPDEYQLTLFQRAEEALQMVHARIRLQEHSVTDVPPIRLPNHLFQEWRQQVKAGSSVNMVQQMVEQFSCAQEAAELLERTLQNQQCEGQLILLSLKHGGWQVDGITFLSGESANWLIESEQDEQEDWVNITPCSAAKLEQLLRGFVVERLPLVTAV